MTGRRRASREEGLIKIILAVVIVLTTMLAYGVYSLFSYLSSAKEDAALPPPDDSQIALEEEKLENPEGGGAVNVTFHSTVRVDLSDGTVELHFENPQRSNQAMKLSLVTENMTLCTSELLQPGAVLSSLPLSLPDGAQFKEGKYEGKFLVTFYDCETAEEATLCAEFGGVHIEVSQ